MQVRQLDLPCIVAAEPARAWHSVVLFANAKAMEMEIRPVEADLQEDVKIGQGAVGSYEKAPPEHRVDSPNPDVDTVSFALRIVFHYGPAYPMDTASALPSPRFEMLSKLPRLIGWQLFFNAVLSENDSFLLTAKDHPLLAAFKSLFFDSVVNGPLGIL